MKLSKRNLLVGGGIVFFSLILGIYLRGVEGSIVAFDPEPIKTKGALDARTNLVIYFDYECFFSKDVELVLSNLLKSFPNQLKVIYKHFPLTTHPNAKIMAEAAECAGDQGKFWLFHDELFSKAEELNNPGKLSEGLFKISRNLQLDNNKFQTCLDSHENLAIVEKNIKEGRAMHVDEVPTIFINGTDMVQRNTFENISKHINQTL